MAFNGSGTFNRLYNWIDDAAAGVKIRADRMDQEMDGFAAGLTNCITKDGQTTITGPIPFNNNKITGLGNPTNPQDAVTKSYADATYVVASSNTYVTVSTAQDITGVKTFKGGVIIQDNAAGLLQFNNVTWGGRVARIFAGDTGNFVLRPTSAADTDDASNDLFFNNTANRWQTKTGFAIGGDTYLKGLILAAAVANASDGAAFDTLLCRLSISTVDNVSIILNHKDTDGSGSGGIQQFRFNGNVAGSISVSNGGTAYGTSSDANLKANDVPLENVVNVIDLLKDDNIGAKRYTRTQNGRLEVGFIAQNLMSKIPQAVIPGNDLPVNHPEFIPWMRKIGEMEPYLWAICKKQQEKIEELEARLTAAGI